MKEMSDRVIICQTCNGGPELARALRDRVEIPVEEVECLNICDNPVSMALRGPGRDVYLLAGIQDSDLDDAEALVALWLSDPQGKIEDARPAGRLRFCLVGRVPG